jgi:DNA-binding transcriptional ArsR family regulator
MPPDLDRADAVFGALSDRTRRTLLATMAAGSGATATELAAALPISRQAVVKHLGALAEAGLVERERSGREVRYRVTPAPLSDAVSWMTAVGEAWDDLASFACWNPALLGVVGATLAADTLQTLFLTGDQGLKLQGLAMPQATANAFAPWRLFGPALAVLLSSRSGLTLARLKREQVPVFVLHGERDQVVPVAAARDAAERGGGELVLVHEAAHSWLLEDPETLRSIVAELLGDGLGRACLRAMADAGLDPATVSLAEMERAFYAPDALALRLGPVARREEIRAAQPPRFTWTRGSRVA